ncbi:MAG: class I SAM-dependent methyltransferase [Peptococcaceae bacterium]|nr:class I SAM-dependent methyltransferase [Peptococcaceae bacterium]
MTDRKFDPSNRQKLNSEKRRAVLPPDQVIKDINVAPQSTWADIGCGTGYFSIPLAEKVNQVYALDIRSEMLDELRANIAQLSLRNVAVLQSQESSFPLPNGAADGALVAFVLHEVDEPQLFILEVARILKPGGKAIIIEWVKNVSTMGPPLEHRLAIDQVDAWAEAGNLVKTYTWQWSDNFVGLEYSKGLDTDSLR